VTRLDVADLRAPVDAGVLASLRADTRLQWREPLERPDLERIEAWLATRPRAAIRLYGSAAAQAGVLAQWPEFGRLEIAAWAIDAMIAPIGVRALAVDGVPADLRRLASVFPALETLAIVARGAVVDAGAIATAQTLKRVSIAAGKITHAQSLTDMPELVALEIRDATVDDADAVLQTNAVALRLSKIADVRWLDALAERSRLRTLALADLLHLQSLAPIARLRALDCLELTGLWQFGVGDAEFIIGMPSLRFLRIDIGGHRKNVEIYKRSNTLLPPAFELATF